MIIDITKVKPSPKSTKVEASDKIFQELGNNTYDYKDLLSELIDNCIAARIKGNELDVKIQLLIDKDNHVEEFIIIDNAKGIPRNDFGICISPAGKQSSDGLNEHGLGMKQAIAALGSLNYLASKTSEEKMGTLIKEFKFGDITTYDTELPFEHGTIISVKGIKPIVKAHQSTITSSIVPFLGARYRRFLKPDHKQLSLTLEIRNSTTDKIIKSWNIEEVKPIYFHPSTRANQPVLSVIPLEGEHWKARLTFGYAPGDKDEYHELGLEPVNRMHPYNVSLSRQGMDIILHDRVILFSQLSEIGIIHSKHNDYNTIRGEIELIHGFKTAITKNSMIADVNFYECITKIKQILTGEETGTEGKKGKDYLKLKTYPDELPESLLRDRLALWLKTNSLSPKESVNTEYAVGGIEGFIDILADNEAWEIKTQQSNALDVYQLFMYMDIGDINKGYLIAKDFTTGARIAADKIKEKHGKSIKLSKIEEFPINHPTDENERNKYY